MVKLKRGLDLPLNDIRCTNVALGITVGYMKRLGFRAAFLSTNKNAEAGTKRLQTTKPQLFYIVC